MKNKRQRGQAPTLKRRWMESSEDGSSTPRTVRKQEERLGKILGARGGGRRRPGSGSNKLAPGDAVGWKDLGEAKQTSAKSMTIKRDWLAQIEAEARGEGKVPVLHIQWIGVDADPDPRKRCMTTGWGIIPDWFLEKLLQAYEAYHGGNEGVE